MPVCGGDSVGEGRTVISKKKKDKAREENVGPPHPPKMARRFPLLFSGGLSPKWRFPVLSLPHSDPNVWVNRVGRGRGGPSSQSVRGVLCPARCDWLAMTSCCSSGWG